MPDGTGIMVMANDDIEIFDNDVRDHRTAAIVIVSYHITEIAITDPTYEPEPEKIYIHNNTFANNATDPVGIGASIELLFSLDEGQPMPQIYYDSSRVEGAQLPEDSRICIRDNGEVTAGIFDAETALSGVLDLPQLKYSVDLAFFDCAHPSLPEVALDQPGAIDASDPNDQEAISSTPLAPRKLLKRAC